MSFFRSTAIDLGIFFYIWVFILVAGSSNGVNLTDGLDGLAIAEGGSTTANPQALPVVADLPTDVLAAPVPTPDSVAPSSRAFTSKATGFVTSRIVRSPVSL